MNYLLVLLVEKEIVLGRVIRPNVFDGLVDLTIIVEFLKVLDNLLRST